MDMIKAAMTVEETKPEFSMPHCDDMPVHGTIGESNQDRYGHYLTTQLMKMIHNNVKHNHDNV